MRNGRGHGGNAGTTARRRMAGRLSAQVGALAAVVAFLALAGAGCDTVHEIDWTGRPVGLEVTVRPVSGGGLGTPSSPLEMPAGTQGAAGIDVRVDVAVQTADARDSFDEDLWVRLSARPGRAVVAPGDDRHGDFVLLRGGRATDIPVTLQGVFGETRIWAEDTGFLPRRTAGRLSLCGNGVDDDGDGLTDAPFDPGCEDGSDDSEEGGSGAAGVGNPVWVANPTLAQVQGHGTASPYQGEVVTVDSGDMVVTRVTFSGMYVTDIADTSGRGYNHMFVYSFNPPTSVPVCVIDELDTLGCRGEPPVRVRVCDRVSRLSGIMSEFYRFTEMGFPSWDLTLWHADQGPCAVPEPKVLSAADVSGNLEPFEAGLVRVTNVTPGRAEDIVDCDLDGNGEVDFRDYDTDACSAECVCREACDAAPLCTEINQYRQYGQWPVRLGDAANGLKLWVVTSESIPDFDPFDPAWPAQWSAITGTLKNLSFLRPRGWILEPRCMDDIVVSGQPLSSSEACVDPRTGEE